MFSAHGLCIWAHHVRIASSSLLLHSLAFSGSRCLPVGSCHVRIATCTWYSVIWNEFENTLLVRWQNINTATPMTIWVAKRYYWTAINMIREQVTGPMTAQKNRVAKITDWVANQRTVRVDFLPPYVPPRWQKYLWYSEAILCLGVQYLHFLQVWHVHTYWRESKYYFGGKT